MEKDNYKMRQEGAKKLKIGNKERSVKLILKKNKEFYINESVGFCIPVIQEMIKQNFFLHENQFFDVSRKKLKNLTTILQKSINEFGLKQVSVDLKSSNTDGVIIRWLALHKECLDKKFENIVNDQKLINSLHIDEYIFLLKAIIQAKKEEEITGFPYILNVVWGNNVKIKDIIIPHLYLHFIEFLLPKINLMIKLNEEKIVYNSVVLPKNLKESNDKKYLFKKFFLPHQQKKWRCQIMLNCNGDILDSWDIKNYPAGRHRWIYWSPQTKYCVLNLDDRIKIWSVEKRKFIMGDSTHVAYISRINWYLNDQFFIINYNDHYIKIIYIYDETIKSYYFSSGRQIPFGLIGFQYNKEIIVDDYSAHKQSYLSHIFNFDLFITIKTYLDRMNMEDLILMNAILEQKISSHMLNKDAQIFLDIIQNNLI